MISIFIVHHINHLKISGSDLYFLIVHHINHLKISGSDLYFLIVHHINHLKISGSDLYFLIVHHINHLKISGSDFPLKNQLYHTNDIPHFLFAIGTNSLNLTVKKLNLTPI